MAAMAVLTDFTLAITPRKILAGQRFAMIFMRCTATRNGKQLDALMAQGLRIDDQGKIAEWWFVPDDPQGWDDFWS